MQLRIYLWIILSLTMLMEIRFSDVIKSHFKRITVTFHQIKCGKLSKLEFYRVHNIQRERGMGMVRRLLNIINDEVNYNW